MGPSKKQQPPLPKPAPAKPAPAKPKPGSTDFSKAFAAARKAGERTFEWNGKKYTTALKGETTPKTSPIAKMETAQTVRVQTKETPPIDATQKEKTNPIPTGENTFKETGENVRERQMNTPKTNKMSKLGEFMRKRNLAKADRLASRKESEGFEPDNATSKLKEAIRNRQFATASDYLEGGKGKTMMGGGMVKKYAGGGKMDEYKMGGKMDKKKAFMEMITKLKAKKK
jgi:hypothetical protein